MPGNIDVNYHVNQYTKGPSTLLELGFLTNDTSLMEYLQNYKEHAKAVANAIWKFLGVEGLQGDDSDCEKELEQTIIELIMDNDALKAEKKKLNNMVVKIKSGT